MRSRSICPGLLAAALAVAIVGCSSNSSDSSTQGSLRISLAATSAPATGLRAATADDGLSRLSAAAITISSVEARNTDDTWVAVDSGLPAAVDLLAIMNSGGSATLPADVFPAGSYDAIQFGITKVELTLTDGTQIDITPPGNGWTVQLALDFTVVAGESTTVNLKFRCHESFKLINGEFEFDPQVEVEDIEHDGLMHN